MTAKLNILENENVTICEDELKKLYAKKAMLEAEISFWRDTLENILRQAEKEQGKKFCSVGWILTRSEKKQVNKISIAKLKMYVTDEIIKRCQTTTWQSVQGLIKKPR